MITSKTNNLSEYDFAEGQVILIDKETGFSSFSVVKKIRGITKVKKVGHAGTLDPNATGLLIVCTGKKTKEINLYQDLGKTYSGTITLGVCTESMDGESNVIEEKSIENVTDTMIFESIEKFRGEIEQIPPMYSALKHKGQALYKYARKGVEIKREPRKVTVYDLVITEIKMPEVKFVLKCSKGTYVRVIADDLGKELGCGAFLSSLRREKIGDYSVEDALNVKEFETLYRCNTN